MEKNQLIELFRKYHEGKCTEEEKALLEDWYLQHSKQSEFDLDPRRIQAIGNKLFRELPGNHSAFMKVGLRLAAAAVIIGLLITVTLKFIPKPAAPQVAAQHDIAPGSNTATLTLANGKKIDLKKAANGQVALQSGVQILKSANGQLTYKITGADIADNKGPNIITTPMGGQWQVTLPDGTKVWLNSATQFSYPATFENQKERVVQLNGEAYFEVAKDKQHPFVVKTSQQEVRVFGTHFNINSYPDEPTVNTTLAEGNVKVTDITGNTKFLLPGQQAISQKGNLSISGANVEEALAWKNGYFRFNDEDIQSIMRKLSRWYNIDVQYTGDISNDRLNGKVSRYKNISQVLKALEATQTVHFKIEGRRVTVSK